MIRIQWGDSSFLSDSELALKDVPFIPSIGDPEFDDSFVSYPEFGVFCQSKLGESCTAELLIDTDLVRIVLD